MILNSFNNHYEEIFRLGSKINIDKGIFLICIRDHPGGPKCVDKKQIGTGKD